MSKERRAAAQKTAIAEATPAPGAKAAAAGTAAPTHAASAQEEGLMEVGTLVLVHLVQPKEKYWGLLTVAHPRRPHRPGGIELDLFDDWARQHRPDAEQELGVANMFFPLHRIEKIFEDTRVGSVASYHERFFQMVGRDVREVLHVARRDGIPGPDQLKRRR